MRNRRFTIKGDYSGSHCFPSLNEYLAEMGRHPQAGARLKRIYENIAITAIQMQLRGYKAVKPVILHYRIYINCHGRRADHMNLAAFADKVIEDSLVKAKVLVDDNPKYVRNADFYFEYVDAKPSIEVEIEETDEPLNGVLK